MDFGAIIAVLLTLAIFTFLYKDNPFYKLAEALLIGLSIGYTLVIIWETSIIGLLFRPLFGDGNLSLIIPLLLGLCMFLRLHPKTASLSRIPLALMIGSGAGVAIPAMLDARTLKQVSATVVPLVASGGGLNVSGLIVLLGVLSCLSYFFFSRAHTGLLGGSAKFGTYILMIFFGTTFGYTVMSRMSTLIGRLEFLYSQAFHITK
jgi:hypothetical protein